MTTQPPGWYPAEGDPPGTHRYWDGSQWTTDAQPIGGGMPSGGASPGVDSGPLGGGMGDGAMGGAAMGGGPVGASSMGPGSMGTMGAGEEAGDFGTRFVARLIDGLLLLPIGIAVAILAAILGAVSDALGGLMVLVWYAIALAWTFYVLGYLLGETGQTPGKRMMGLKVVDANTGQPMGGGRGVGRVFTDYVNGLICFLGWLWPLWDSQSQTISDKIIGSRVVKGPKGGVLPIFPDGKPF